MSNRVFRSSADKEILIDSPRYDGGHRESQHVIQHRAAIVMGQGQQARGHVPIAGKGKRDGQTQNIEACRIGYASVMSWPSDPVPSS